METFSLPSEKRQQYRLEAKGTASSRPIILSVDIAQGVDRRISVAAMLKNIFKDTASFSGAQHVTICCVSLGPNPLHFQVFQPVYKTKSFSSKQLHDSKDKLVFLIILKQKSSALNSRLCNVL